MDYPGEEVIFEDDTTHRNTRTPEVFCDCTPQPAVDPPEQYFTPENPRPAAKINWMFWYMDASGKGLKCKVVWSDGHEKVFDWFSQSRNILNIQQQLVEQNHA